MSLRRFYTTEETDEAVQTYFFILSQVLCTEECPVCFETTENKENVLCHECEKCFHLNCIEEWFETNTSRPCPHCRTPWKFEIDIVVKEPPTYIELDEYTPMPDYRRCNTNTSQRNQHNQRNTNQYNRYTIPNLTVRGSIAGRINRPGSRNISEMQNLVTTILPTNVDHMNSRRIEQIISDGMLHTKSTL